MLLRYAEPYWRFRRELYNRFRRKDVPYILMSAKDEHVPVPFEYYITHMVQGYLSGKAPTYTVMEGDTSENFQQEIDYIRRYNDDGSVFAELIHNYITTGAAYLYVMESEDNEITYAWMDSLNSICVYDFGTPPYPIAFLRRSEELDLDGVTVIIKLEIITDSVRRIFTADGMPVEFVDFDDSGNETTMLEKHLLWGDVPVTPFENPSSIAVYEPVLGLIDMYENMITNLKNMTQYNDDAKLLLLNYNPNNPMFTNVMGADGMMVVDRFGNPAREVNPAWKQEEKELFDAKAIFLREDGDIKWLIKQVDYNGILDVLKKLEELITMLSNVPNMTDASFSGNASGVALEFKNYGLNQYAAVVDRIFKKGYLRLWELITSRINLKKNTDYDFTHIIIGFQRNIPTDKNAQMERAIKAKDGGLLSLKSAISNSGIDVDPSSEVIKIQADQIRPSKPEQIIELRNNQLISEEYALQLLYGEEIGIEESDRLTEENLSMPNEPVINDLTGQIQQDAQGQQPTNTQQIQPLVGQSIPAQYIGR